MTAYGYNGKGDRGLDYDITMPTFLHMFPLRDFGQIQVIFTSKTPIDFE